MIFIDIALLTILITVYGVAWVGLTYIDDVSHRFSMWWRKRK